MKQRILSALLCVCMIIFSAPVSVLATESEDDAGIPMLLSLSDVVYTDDTASGIGTGTAADPYQDFETALANVTEGGTIIIGAGGAYVGVDGTNDSTPLVIDKAVTITSESGSDLCLRRAGIILGADVTFENMAIALTNKEKNAIFANGHTLTLTNVTQLSGTRAVHLFAGGVAGSTAAKGGHGKIIINGSAAQFGNIYAGSMNEGSDLPATITINSTTDKSLGNVYACGAKTGVYDASDLFGGTEPEAPVPSEENYPVNGTVTIELNNSKVSNIYGLASNTNKADVIFSTVYPNYNMEFSDIGTLTVKSGNLIPKALNADVNVSINNGTYLDLSAVMVDNTFSVTDFTGGGTLRLGKDDTLTVKGNISGVTAFEVADANVLSGSGIALENHGYIDASAAAGDGTFTFKPYALQSGMILEKQRGVWTTVMSTVADVVSVEIDGNVTNYTDMESAWNTVCESTTAVKATMTLLRPVMVAENKQLILANSNVDLTLDVDGYTLSGSGKGSDGKNGLIYVSAGNLTVQDSYDGLYGIYDEYTSDDGCAICVDGGSLTVLSGNIAGESWGIRVVRGNVSLSGGFISGLTIDASADLTVRDLLAPGYGYKTSTGWITDMSLKTIAEEVEVQEQELPSEEAVPTVTVRSPTAGEYRLTLSGIDADSGTVAVSFAVWGDIDGQNDLRYYNASSNGEGTWSATFPITNHRENGIYHVWAYTVNSSGESTCVVRTAFLHEESASIQGIEIRNLNSSTGTFDVFITGVSATSGVDSVQVPVWSQPDQSDIRWYEAWRQSDGSYATQINLQNHNYNYAEYSVHVYVTSGTQAQTFVGATTVTVNPPQAAVQAILSSDEKTASLSASNVGLAGGVQNVYFAVWSDEGGQDDLMWYQAKQNSGGVWKKDISIATHKTAGTYHVHLYGEKNIGERVFLGNTTFNVTGVEAESIKAKNVFGANGTFDIFIDGITCPSGVMSVQLAVWSKDDQSDLRWYTAWEQSDGTYAMQVNIGDHGYRYGKYAIHANVTAGNGIVQYIGGTSVEIYPPSASIQTLLASDENTCKLIADSVKLAGGVQKAYFAVWSENGGQDDLVWHVAEQVSEGMWRKDLSIATHKTAGTYQVHLYGENANGTKVLLGNTTFSVAGARVQSIEVKNVLPANGTFDVFIYGVDAPSGVVKVQVPVWSESDQSDTRWYTAWKLCDGSYATQVNIQNHNNNYGKYTIHTYVTAGNGVYGFTGATSVTISAP
ncbi:MAG: GBS Bsp-like repeat-containing protein [Roseburia sp.]|nr:GBS Bsp-like repeat-containing protein [Roseburia sp.]